MYLCTDEVMLDIADAGVFIDGDPDFGSHFGQRACHFLFQCRLCVRTDAMSRKNMTYRRF